jgi:hypothetical protein
MTREIANARRQNVGRRAAPSTPRLSLGQFSFDADSQAAWTSQRDVPTSKISNDAYHFIVPALLHQYTKKPPRTGRDGFSRQAAP